MSQNKGMHVWERIVALVLASVVIITLIVYVFFLPERTDSATIGLIRFFAALLAGLSAYLFAGNLDLEGKMPLGKLGVRASGAFAVFLAILLFFYWGIPEPDGRSNDEANSSTDSNSTVPIESQTSTAQPLEEQASSPGFEITDVIATANPDGGSWTLDFRLLNNSATSVTLSRIRFVTEKYEYFPSDRVSGLEVSATYEVDLEPLEKDGSKVEHTISHVLKPLEADRFKIIIGRTDVYWVDRRVWHLKPTLITSAGEKEWSTIEIVVPAPR
ncbi:MAG: hypothetical protein AAF821_24140 [Cyanobacteria bacterium P01_D01_bin.156]